ncbi:hypothetical protein [Deinococcus sp. PEB2-63]
MLTLLIAATILGLLLIVRLARYRTPTLWLGEGETFQRTPEKRLPGTRIRAAQLTRALAARTAVRGDDGMVTVRGRA